MLSRFSISKLRCILPRVTLSIVLITQDEERHLPRTLESVMPLVRDGKGEIIVVDSGSTDRTVEIAQSYGAKVFVEKWKGFAAQKNSAMDKASMDWVLQLDADEPLEPELVREIYAAIRGIPFPAFPAELDKADSLDTVEKLVAAEEAEPRRGEV